MNEIKTNYIECCDCMDGLKKIPDNSVDLVIADPPYLFDATGGGAFGVKKRRYHSEFTGVDKYSSRIDKSKAKQRYQLGESLVNGFNEQIFTELRRVMKKVNIYVWCSKAQIKRHLEVFSDCNMELLTWHKLNPIPACGNSYLPDTEYLLFFREKGVKVYGSYETKRKWYATNLNTKDKNKYGHPTIKPLHITENLIINSSQEGEVVLDPFLGSGTTAVACMNTNRKYIGFEKNEQYFKVAQRRMGEVKECSKQ